MHPLLKNKSFIAVIGGIIIFSVLGYTVGTHVQKRRYMQFVESFKTIRENSDKYKHINPRVGSVSQPATDVGFYSDVKSDIISFLAREKIKGNLLDYSFYFKDLNSGLWFGELESKSFFPASLFKLPLAIAAYKQAEYDSTFLNKKVIYTEEIANLNGSKELNGGSSLRIGQSYTVESLIEKMLTLSDNGAKDLLLHAIDQSYLNQLFETVSMVDPSKTQTFEVSSRKYSAFLTILYGSSYLNEDHSELLLGMLTQATFKDGLVAGLPPTVSVAHKFGVYEFPENIEGKDILTVQLHDCGVVYHATNPYIICFMTKGKDAESLYNIISHISKMMYDYQENND